MSNSKRVLLLDGGTGMSLVEMGHKFIDTDPLWSAAVISTHPEDLVKLHKDFFLAGADIVLSATYQASAEGFKSRFGISDTEAFGLIRKGVELAKEARDEAEKLTGFHKFVAASVGPYGATLCDRSEYHGRYSDTMTKEELSAWHLPRLQVLVDSLPDLLAIETIPVLMEAEAILDSLRHFPHMKAWVTFQCKDGEHTAHGENIQDAVRSVVRYDNVIAVGVNCVHPSFVLSLVQNISACKLNIPIVVKPNGGIFQQDGRSGSKYNLSDHVLEWLDAGATWIGGCCHIYPADITDLRKTLENVPNIHFIQKGDGLV
ncbi:unnamed protein product [Lymnaea stagnalis]|uniref:Hcy-binding domain-containing protein n=1 Tax=Lymnaea stagnalis TaxID=6523 RepID=A0AAV2I7C3_LYMST